MLFKYLGGLIRFLIKFYIPIVGLITCLPVCLWATEKPNRFEFLSILSYLWGQKIRVSSSLLTIRFVWLSIVLTISIYIWALAELFKWHNTHAIQLHGYIRSVVWLDGRSLFVLLLRVVLAHFQGDCLYSLSSLWFVLLTLCGW